MKATGIVRRIDDLGRIVIPKEIRRTLRLREGTPLEIYTDTEGGIVLKKYSPMEDMVKGAIDTLNVDYAISATGFAGPSSDSPLVPVGTIWLACGSKDDVVTLKLEEDNGRDLNLANATSQALKLFLEYITQRLPVEETEG